MAPPKKQQQTAQEAPIEVQEDAPALPPIDQESMQSAAEQRVDETPDDEMTNVVRYVGVVSERQISREDWEQAGVPDQEGVVWRKDQGNWVSLDRFSPEAIRVLQATGEFQIVRDEK